MGDQPTYVAFFGVMGATSAMVFSGKYLNRLVFKTLTFLVKFNLEVKSSIF